MATASNGINTAESIKSDIFKKSLSIPSLRSMPITTLESRSIPLVLSNYIDATCSDVYLYPFSICLHPTRLNIAKLIIAFLICINLCLNLNSSYQYNLIEHKVFKKKEVSIRIIDHYFS